MASKPILKIAKPGIDITNNDIRNFLFHSDYTCFKLDQIKTGSITINAGSQTGYVDITHNLGKVAFLVYGENNDLFPQGVVAYNDGTKIRITFTLDAPYDQTITPYYSSDVYNENGWVDDATGEITQWFYAGKSYDGSGNGSAIRWNGLVINQGQTIDAASFDLNSIFTTAGCDIKFKIWGMDEDNTSDFSGGSPMGRTKTTAERDKTQSASANKFNFGDDFTTLLQEVVDRVGWSSGNAFGIIVNDNGTADNSHWLQHDVADRISDNMILTVTLTGTGSFTTNYKVVFFKDKVA